MKLENIAYSRLACQHIENRNLNTPMDIVSCMGAMQAQDYYMVKWAIGIRLPNTTG